VNGFGEVLLKDQGGNLGHECRVPSESSLDGRAELPTRVMSDKFAFEHVIVRRPDLHWAVGLNDPNTVGRQSPEGVLWVE
jgi:hypothetical protein